MSREILRRRLDAISDLTVRILADEEYAAHAAKARAMFFPFSAFKVMRHDITDEPPASVRQLLTDWSLASDVECYALWLGETAGVAITGRAFLEHYDDLWFPGSDDVWIVPGDFSRLVGLSHEEEAYLVLPR